MNEPIKSWVRQATTTLDLLYNYDKTKAHNLASQMQSRLNETEAHEQTMQAIMDDPEEMAQKLIHFEKISKQLFDEHIQVLDYANTCINEERELQERVETLIQRMESVEQALKNEKDSKQMLIQKHEEVESMYQEELGQLESKLGQLESKLAKLNNENRHLMSYREDIQTQMAEQLEELGRQKCKLELANKTLNTNCEQIEGEVIGSKMQLKDWQEHSYIFLMLIFRFSQCKRLWKLFFNSIQRSLHASRFSNSMRDFPLDSLRMLNLILESKLACSSDSGSNRSESSFEHPADNSERVTTSNSDTSMDDTCVVVEPFSAVKSSPQSPSTDSSCDSSQLSNSWKEPILEQIAKSLLDEYVLKMLVKFVVQEQCRSAEPKTNPPRVQNYRKRMIQNGLLLHPAMHGTNDDHSSSSGRSSPANSSFAVDVTREILNPFEESLADQVAKAVAQNTDKDGENLFDILNNDRHFNFDDTCSNTSAYEDRGESGSDQDGSNDSHQDQHEQPESSPMDRTRTIILRQPAPVSLPIITVTHLPNCGPNEPVCSVPSDVVSQMDVQHFAPMNLEIEILNESQHIKDMMSAKDLDSRRSISQIGVNVTVHPKMLAVIRRAYGWLLRYMPWILCILIALLHFQPLLCRLIGQLWWNNIDNISKFVATFVTFEYIHEN